MLLQLDKLYLFTTLFCSFYHLFFYYYFFPSEHVCRPNEGFVEQLKLWGAMRCRLDLNYKPYKVYRLQMHSTTRDNTEGAQEIQWNLQNKDTLRKDKIEIQ